MKTYSIKPILMVMLIGLMFQSCEQDEFATAETTEELRGSRGDRGNQGKRGSVDDLSNDILNEWSEVFLELDRHARGMRPNATARAIAYINLAAYETAIPGMRSYVSTQNLLDGLSIDEDELPRDIDYLLALNACYADVLDHFMLNLPEEERTKIAVTETALEEKYASNKKDRDVEDSQEWGAYVAKQVIAYSQTDQQAETQILSPQPLSYEPPTGDGYWTYSDDPERALFPYWKSTRTFVIGPEQTTSVPPLAYSSIEGTPYYEEMTEVYEVNNKAKEEQNDDLWIAEFWSDDVEGLMMSPPGRQISIADQLIDKYDLNLEESLVLFMKLGFSLNDAAVSTWKYKYDYMVMRPSNYIQKFIDPEFQTNLYRLIYWPNPSFPGYPSGHSSFASAAAGLFIAEFGDATNFTDRSHEGRTEFQGAPRNFGSFTELAEENAFSRIPLGVHIRMDCVEGIRLGYEISEAVSKLDIEKDPS